MKNLKKRCPVCNDSARRIIYGLPTSETFRAAERGEVELGGCTFSYPFSPKWRCPACGHEFGVEPIEPEDEN